MGKRDLRVDAYISKAADFAKPILNQLREAVHASCPDVEEDMKWSFPHFMYKGMLCSMASFKEHAAFGFWKGSLIFDDEAKSSEAMGDLGRLTKPSDLPAKKVLAGYIKKAMALNDEGVKVARVPKRAAPKAVRVPEDLTAALTGRYQVALGCPRLWRDADHRPAAVAHEPALSAPALLFFFEVVRLFATRTDRLFDDPWLVRLHFCDKRLCAHETRLSLTTKAELHGIKCESE